MRRPWHIIPTTIRNLQAAWWRFKQTNFLAIVNWHQITPVFDPDRQNKNIWTPLEKFETGIDYLASEFKTLPLYEAINRLKQGSLRGPCVSLTFDDGDVSLAEYILPLLRRRNLPATFFINTAYMERPQSCWVPILSYLQNDLDRYRSAGFSAALESKALQLRQTKDSTFYNEVRLQIEELAPLVPDLAQRRVDLEWLSGLDGDQFAIGAHGHEHERYSMMSSDWQRRDLSENVRLLSQFKGYRPIFAMPFGRRQDWTEETVAIAHDLKLEVAAADGGINVAASSCYQRIPSDGGNIPSLITEAMIGQTG
jgi:peptidoglycan/xylan/chitin deacetylase (PgdA/CDA1 family)